MQNIAFWSAKRLAGHIRRRRIGCLELLDLYLARVARYNPSLNAIIATDIQGARKRARAADRALARGQVWGPLHGVPMTIKESFDVAGMPTTWGMPALKANIASKNALAVDRLLAAGVVLFGKTNVPLMLADWQSYNEVYGTTNNPWDLGRTPGGARPAGRPPHWPQAWRGSRPAATSAPRSATRRTIAASLGISPRTASVRRAGRRCPGASRPPISR
jgi:amidase